MALTKLNNYANDDTNILEMQITEDASFIGKHKVSLTEMSTATVPAIAAGSIIEVNGTLLRANTEQAISTTDPVTSATVADGTVYIMIDGTTKLPYFTATAPTWSDSKQGWYGLTTWANWRYIHAYALKASTSYTYKTLVPGLSGTPLVYQTPSRTEISRVGFKAVKTTTQSIANTNPQSITYDSETYDLGSNFSSPSFTAPRDGYYLFTAYITMSETGNATGVMTHSLVVGSPAIVSNTFNVTPLQLNVRSSISVIHKMSAGSTISSVIDRDSASGYDVLTGTSFAGYLLSEL